MYAVYHPSTHRHMPMCMCILHAVYAVKPRPWPSLSCYLPLCITLMLYISQLTCPLVNTPIDSLKKKMLKGCYWLMCYLKGCYSLMCYLKGCYGSVCYLKGCYGSVCYLKGCYGLAAWRQKQPPAVCVIWRVLSGRCPANTCYLNKKNLLSDESR